MLENTFTSIPEMAKRLFQVFLLDYIPHWCYKNLVGRICGDTDENVSLSSTQLLSLSKIRHIQVPVLFLSGEQDELVPLQMMQKLYEVSETIF